MSLGLIHPQLSNLFFLNIQWYILPWNYWCALCRNPSLFVKNSKDPHSIIRLLMFHTKVVYYTAEPMVNIAAEWRYTMVQNIYIYIAFPVWPVDTQSSSVNAPFR